MGDRPKIGQWAFLSTQHLFAMFGSTVLVPFLTGSNIIGTFSIRDRTLLYILITKAKYLLISDQALPL